MVERGGKLTVRKVENTSVEKITPEVIRNIKDTMIYTDEWVGYKHVNRLYNHLFVKHNEGQSE